MQCPSLHSGLAHRTNLSFTRISASLPVASSTISTASLGYITQSHLRFVVIILPTLTCRLWRLTLSICQGDLNQSADRKMSLTLGYKCQKISGENSPINLFFSLLIKKTQKVKKKCVRVIFYLKFSSFLNSDICPKYVLLFTQ